MCSIIRANSLRGTVASSRIVVGAMRASEENAARRAVANRRASSTVWAILTSRACNARAISAMRCDSSSRAAGCPLSQSHSNQKRSVFPQVPRSDAPGLGSVRRKDIFPENADVKRPDRLAAGNRQTGKIGIFFPLNGERTIWLGLDNLLHMRHEPPNRQKRITPTGRKL